MAFSDPLASSSSSNSYINGLEWGNYWDDPGSAVTTRLAVYIAGAGGMYERFSFGGGPVIANTDAHEMAAFTLATQLIENVCNIDFQFVGSQATADIIVGAVSETYIGAYLGVTTPPGASVGPLASQQGSVIINYDRYSSTDGSSLLQGGYDFITFIHELGHAVGLKHPHDTGGANPGPTFPGVPAGSEFGVLGDNHLNQGVYTMMSYNDGWQDRPAGVLDIATVSAYGYEATPMALDVATLQYLYGANTTFHTGSDSYALAASNAAGAFYSCIWDAGGNDTIVNNSALGSTIDLRAATLLNQPGGGGFISSVNGIDGGFTIANGVVIENATGGSASDILIGNSAANRLNGGFGNDTLIFTGGVDSLNGEDGAGDLADYSAFAFAVLVDLAITGAQYTKGTKDLYSGTWTSIGTVSGIENLRGTNVDDSLFGDGNANTFFYTGGKDNYDGRGGVDTVDFNSFGSATYLDLDHGAQYTRDGTNIFGPGAWRILAYTVASSFENAVGTVASDYIYGSAADNIFTYCGGLDDSYYGLAGTDKLDLSRLTNAVYADLNSGVTYDRGNSNWNVGGIYNRIVFTNTIENLSGGAGGDYLAGATNVNNTLTGGLGADSFVFRPNSGGYDVITDFQDGADRIRLEHYGAGGDFAHLAIVYDASGAYFSNTVDSGDYVRVFGVANGSLTASDFDFLV